MNARIPRSAAYVWCGMTSLLILSLTAFCLAGTPASNRLTGHSGPAPAVNLATPTPYPSADDDDGCSPEQMRHDWCEARYLLTI